MKLESGGPDVLLDFFRQEGMALYITIYNSTMQIIQLCIDCFQRFWV